MWVRGGESGKVKHAYTTRANQSFLFPFFPSRFLFGAQDKLLHLYNQVSPPCSVPVHACVREWASLRMHARVSGSGATGPPEMMSEFQEWLEGDATDTGENSGRERVRVRACVRVSACVSGSGRTSVCHLLQWDQGQKSTRGHAPADSKQRSLMM